MQSVQTVMNQGSGFVPRSGDASPTRSRMGMLVGKELIVECLDYYMRTGDWDFTRAETQRFASDATDLFIRARFQPELIRMIDEVLEHVVAKRLGNSAGCQTCQ